MTTEAGKRLYNGYIRDGVAHVAEAADIAAIEAEARRAALTALRAEVEGLFGQFHPMAAIEDEPTCHDVVSRKACLTAIDRALGEP